MIKKPWGGNSKVKTGKRKPTLDHGASVGDRSDSLQLMLSENELPTDRDQGQGQTMFSKGLCMAVLV